MTSKIDWAVFGYPTNGRCVECGEVFAVIVRDQPDGPRDKTRESAELYRQEVEHIKSDHPERWAWIHSLDGPPK